MRTNYQLSAPLSEREDAFRSIRRIENFYLSNFPDYSSVLDKESIREEKDYFEHLSADPSVELSEKNRIKSAVGLLRKIKSFNESYSMPKGGLSGHDFHTIAEALSEQVFMQDTGVEIRVNLESEKEGFLMVNVHSEHDQSKGLKLPFVIQWRNEVGEDFEGNEVSLQIGHLELLDQGRQFPNVFSALQGFTFTDRETIGLSLETAYSINDIQESSIIMKANVLDFSDTLELLQYSSQYATKYSEPKLTSRLTQ